MVSIIELGDTVLVPIFGRLGISRLRSRRCGAAETIETEWGTVFCRIRSRMPSKDSACCCNFRAIHPRLWRNHWLKSVRFVGTMVRFFMLMPRHSLSVWICQSMLGKLMPFQWVFKMFVGATRCRAYHVQRTN